MSHGESDFIGILHILLYKKTIFSWNFWLRKGKFSLRQILFFFRVYVKNELILRLRNFPFPSQEFDVEKLIFIKHKVQIRPKIRISHES